LSIRKRNGKYYFRYDVIDTMTGKRKQKETRGYNSERELKPEMIRIQSELLAGTYVEEKNIGFLEWVDRWLEIYGSTGKVKNRTVDIRRLSLQAAKKKFSGLKVKEVTPLQYQNLLDELKADGSAKRTIEMLHEACNMMFRKAVQLEIIKTNPTLLAEIPAFPQTVEQLENEDELPKYLEKEELAKLLNTAKEYGDPQGYHALFILAYTGMRIGELCALKISDIDEINKQINITKTLYDRKGLRKFELNTPKTKSSIRKIDVSSTVIGIIKKQEKWRNEYKIAQRKKFYNNEQFVFINNKQLPGYPAPIKQFETFMKIILEEAGLSNALTPHSLRHTYTSLMAEAGVELPAIQRLLGHRNDSVTRDVYLHVTKAKKREAVDKLDLLMNGLL